MSEQLLQPLIAGLVLVGMLAWLVHELRKRPSLLRQLEDELHEHGWFGRGLPRVRRFRMPVYSAETVHGKEAEFLRDRLPPKLPTLLVVAGVAMVVLLAAWWAVR